MTLCLPLVAYTIGMCLSVIQVPFIATANGIVSGLHAEVLRMLQKGCSGLVVNGLAAYEFPAVPHRAVAQHRRRGRQQLGDDDPAVANYAASETLNIIGLE